MLADHSKSALQDDPVYNNDLTDQERLLLWEQGTCPTSKVSHLAALWEEISNQYHGEFVLEVAAIFFLLG